MQTPTFVRSSFPALLLVVGGACGSPSSPDTGGGAPSKQVGAQDEPAPSGDAKAVGTTPQPPRPTIQPPAPAGEPLLVIDPKQEPSTPSPLAGISVYACHKAGTAPLRCGLAAACEDLAQRWVEQLDVGPAAKASVDALVYPEQPCPDARLRAPHGGFVPNAAILQHRLEVLVDDEVAELMIRTVEGWRSAARITEVAATGMASQKRHQPVASWRLDLDADADEELVVLIRGRDSGHAAKSDPFTRAWVVVCDDGSPACRRLRIGEWLEGTHEEFATPAQQEASWFGLLRILPGGAFELDADDPAHDRTLQLEDFEPADVPLVPG